MFTNYKFRLSDFKCTFIILKQTFNPIILFHIYHISYLTILVFSYPVFNPPLSTKRWHLSYPIMCNTVIFLFFPILPCRSTFLLSVFVFLFLMDYTCLLYMKFAVSIFVLPISLWNWLKNNFWFWIKDLMKETVPKPLGFRDSLRRDWVVIRNLTVYMICQCSRSQNSNFTCY